MADDDKTRLAEKGLELIEAATPKRIKRRIKDSASEAAVDAVLRGVEAVGQITGDTPSDDREQPRRMVDVSCALEAMSDRSLESFDARLKASRSDPELVRKRELHKKHQELRRDLQTVRRSFPTESKEFALLVFACMDLLDDLRQASEGQKKLSAPDLEQREKLLARITELLVPRAGDALTSFVNHVLALSGRSKESGGGE